MVRVSTTLGIVLLLLLVLICHNVPCFEGRKLLDMEKRETTSFKGNSSALIVPLKGNDLNPSPSLNDRVHAISAYERLIVSHLSKIDRILINSVPSPGAGH
ncbi:hypothetical protein JCGZ_10579 [Jatropha curcas]|uniref:Uncharacterized protein n=1 Tax=Jatropha curcas TaxID=180498 RepID=A0A067KSJ9_JATCU|nr:hypothetical protein JCGZ_10579 [Jatropha curcas]